MAIGRTFAESCRRPCARWRRASPGSTRCDRRARRRSTELRSGRARHARRPTGCGRSPRRCAPGSRQADASTSDAHRSVVPAPRWRPMVDAEEAGCPRAGPACSTTRPTLRALKRMGFSDRRLAKLTGVTEERGPPGAHARLASARCTSASTPAPPSSQSPTPYMYSTYEEPLRRARPKCEADTESDREEDRHPGRRPQPHRPGHRVRLLLLPRRLRPARGRLRDHHGQLQPRDRLDRLRHLRPALLRAADRRGRAGDHRRGATNGNSRA